MARKGNKKSNSKSRTVSAGETTEEHSSSNCEAVEVASRSTYSYDSEDETPKDEEFYEKNEQEQEELEESESESGAYEIIPMLCSLMRKGTIVMIRNRPCKIVEMSTSKTGKHGHAKCHYIGIDVITGKKLDAHSTTSDNVEVPARVEKDDYRVTRIVNERLIEVQGLKSASSTAPVLATKLVTVNSAHLETIEELMNKGGALVTVISVLKEHGVVTIRQLPASSSRK